MPVPRSRTPHMTGATPKLRSAGPSVGEVPRAGGHLDASQGDFNWQRRFVQVQRNLVRGVLTTPKNHQRRRIDLSDQLTAAPRLWRRQQRAAWLAVGRPFPEWVFSSVTGTALDESNVRKALNRILDGAGAHVVDRIRCATRLRRCCCRRARRSRTSASNSAIVIRRSRCACRRTGCRMEPRTKAIFPSLRCFRVRGTGGHSCCLRACAEDRHGRGNDRRGAGDERTRAGSRSSLAGASRSRAAD